MIQRIEALNYRGLRYVSQDVRPFQVLVGPNASGKSTFLDVVTLLGDFVRYGVDEALLFSEERGKGRARRLDELIFNQSAHTFDLAIELAVPEAIYVSQQQNGNRPFHDRARYEVSFGSSAKGELEIHHETLWMIEKQRNIRRPSPAERPPEIFPQEPRPPETVMTTGKTPAGWQTVVRKVARSGNDYFKAESSKWNIQFRAGPRKAALASLPEDTERFPVAIWVRNVLLDGIQVLALNSAAMRRPTSPSVSRDFSVDGANLPLVVQDLKHNHPLAFTDWVAHLQTILPDVKTIEVRERPEDRHLYLALSYTSAIEPVPSWLISDGTLRVLALTLLAYLPGQFNIYLIEEPENGIHPRALEGVFLSLSSVYNGQVLVATHSPMFLGLAQPEQMLCFAKTPSGAVDIVSGDQHPALKGWQGEIELSTLYAAGVLG